MSVVGSTGNDSAGVAPLAIKGADVIAAHLEALGVRHVFGVGGANIEDVFLAVQRRRPHLMAILDKHEYSAGTAADAYARVRRSLGVVMTTSGGGATNLVSALAESLASRVPILAIVGEPPSTLQGRGAFQDTSGHGGSVDVQAVFRGVSVWCERAKSLDDLPVLLEAAARSALEKRAPAVLLAAKDLQQGLVPPYVNRGAEAPAHQSPAVPDLAVIRDACRILQKGPVVIVAGDEVSRTGAQEQLDRLATALDARVVLAPDARDAFDNRDPRFAGVSGAMGHQSAVHAVTDAQTCLLVGTRLPVIARQGLEAILTTKTVVSVAREAPFIPSPKALHIGGDLVTNLRALAVELEEKSRDAARVPVEFFKETSPSIASSFGSEGVLRIVERTLPEDGVVLVDAGNTGVHAVHYIRAPRRSHWLVAMGMAGMGYTFGAAVGAAFATGRRAVVLAGDGAFFMHGLEIHTAVQYQLPITYVIFNNSAHWMCLIRERLLLGEEAGYNIFCESHIGRGLAAMFPGLHASDCRALDEVERALAHAATLMGPSVVCVELASVEVPPFAVFQEALAASKASRESPARP